MPGEQLTSMTLAVRQLRTVPTPLAFRLRLGGAWVSFRATSTNQYYPGTPGGNGDLYEFNGYTYAELGRGVESLLTAIRLACTNRGLAYTVSAKRDVTATDPGSPTTFEFDVQAAVYDRSLDLDFGMLYSSVSTPTIFLVRSVPTIRPVQVDVAITPAGIFDSPTGGVVLTGRNGNDGVYRYEWDDFGAPASRTRTNLPNATYSCTVTDTSGAYAYVQVVVPSDPRLDVLVVRVVDDVTLVPSGGLPGYTYAWLDGPTTAGRRALSVGTYTCTVTDSRGATRVVTVTVDPYRYYWSLNPITLRLDAGDAYRLDPGTKPNLSFLCQVWVEAAYDSGGYTQVAGQLEQPADRDGRTVFDVQALLDAYLSAQLPALNERSIRRATPHFRRFYLKHAEKYGTPPVAAPLTSQQQHYVVLGGLDFLNYPTGAWLNYQAQVRPFLTWELNDKQVLPTQPEYLAFMPDSFALTGFRQWVRRRFADGSTQDVLQEEVAGSVRRYEVYHLPAGYAQLGLGGPAGIALGRTPVVAWDVWVSDLADLPVSEVRRYQLDTTYYPKPRFLVYLNSLGGWNTLAVTGDAKAGLDVEAETSARGLGADYDPLLGTDLLLQTSAQGTLTLTTAPRKPAQLYRDQELLLSRRVVLQAAGQYWSGQVKAKSTPLGDESAGLNRLELEFALARSPLFTPRLPVVPAGRPMASLADGEGARP
jgi:hypothetical protein